MFSRFVENERMLDLMTSRVDISQLLQTLPKIFFFLGTCKRCFRTARLFVINHCKTTWLALTCMKNEISLLISWSVQISTKIRVFRRSSKTRIFLNLKTISEIRRQSNQVSYNTLSCNWCKGCVNARSRCKLTKYISNNSKKSVIQAEF